MLDGAFHPRNGAGDAAIVEGAVGLQTRDGRSMSSASNSRRFRRVRSCASESSRAESSVSASDVGVGRFSPGTWHPAAIAATFYEPNRVISGLCRRLAAAWLAGLALLKMVLAI